MRSCFFFQAEDGIRDGRVTGVQTCALPILTACGGQVRTDTEETQSPPAHTASAPAPAGTGGAKDDTPVRPRGTGGGPEIGRASCRERVEIAVVGGSFQEKNEGHEVGDDRPT